MADFDRKKHWENIYETKEPNEVSWYQPTAETSLELIAQFNLPRDARIIDVGGGDSVLVDRLVELGYENISVLDISEAAIARAKERLGSNAGKVRWIVSDIMDFVATETFDLWHDRAAFHFLTNEDEVIRYLETAGKCIKPEGAMIIGTFSKQGPKKCSGIEIRQYSEESMTHRMEQYFDKIKCITVDHKTPFDTIQNFVFCGFRKRPA